VGSKKNPHRAAQRKKKRPSNNSHKDLAFHPKRGKKRTKTDYKAIESNKTEQRKGVHYKKKLKEWDKFLGRPKRKGTTKQKNLGVPWWKGFGRGRGGKKNHLLSAGYRKGKRKRSGVFFFVVHCQSERGGGASRKTGLRARR